MKFFAHRLSPRSYLLYWLGKSKFLFKLTHFFLACDWRDEFWSLARSFLLNFIFVVKLFAHLGELSIYSLHNVFSILFFQLDLILLCLSFLLISVKLLLLLVKELVIIFNRLDVYLGFLIVWIVADENSAVVMTVVLSWVFHNGYDSIHGILTQITISFDKLSLSNDNLNFVCRICITR